MGVLIEKFKSLPGEKKALCVFIPLILVAMLSAWYDNSDAPTKKQFTPAAPIAGTAVTKESVKIQSGVVKVIPKAQVKKSVKPLPPEIDNDDIEVTGTGEVPPSISGTKVISTIDKITGDTKIYTKANPIPLFAFESMKRIGVGYGYSTEGTVAKVFGEYGFARIGNFHLGVQAEIEAATSRDPEAKILGLVDYRW